MVRVWIVLGLAAMLMAPGCLQDGVDQLWTDLEAEPSFEERSLFHDQIDFSASGVLDPENPPQDEGDLSDEWSANVSVPSGTKAMTVVFEVNFTSPEDQGAPSDLSPDQEGQIRLYVEGPGGDNETQEISYEKSAEGGFDFTGPSGGMWTVGFEAVGEGTVDLRVFATVPTDA